MAGLPKKYAKMGFSKGWAAFKRSKKGGKRRTKSKPRAAAPRRSSRPKSRPITRRPAPVPVVHSRGGNTVKVSKSRMAALTAKLSSALRRARENRNPDAGEMALAFTEGVGGGLAGAYILGSIPIGSLPRPGLVKSGVQLVAGGAAALLVKNKHVRYIGFGNAFVGAIGVARELMGVPTFAGEVDEGMYGFLPGPGSNYNPMGGPIEGSMGEPLGDGGFSPYAT